MVEDPIEARIELIEGAIRKDVGLRNRHVASVICDVLSAGEGSGFGKSRRTAWNERSSLVIAEARKHRVLAGKIVVQADVELPFVQLPDGNVRVISAQGRESRSGRGVQIDHVLPNRINQRRRNDVAWSTGSLS